MPLNLRTVVAQYRGERSMGFRRNFSSCPNCSNDSKEAGGRVVANAGWKSTWLVSGLKNPGVFSCAVLGYCTYACWGNVEIIHPLF